MVLSPFRSQKRDAVAASASSLATKGPRVLRGLLWMGAPGDEAMTRHRILLKALPSFGFGWPRPLCGHGWSDCTSSSLRVLIDLAFRDFGEGFVRLLFFGKRAFQKPDSLV
jgi:hypothetical protein